MASLPIKRIFSNLKLYLAYDDSQAQYFLFPYRFPEVSALDIKRLLLFKLYKASAQESSVAGYDFQFTTIWKHFIPAFVFLQTCSV